MNINFDYHGSHYQAGLLKHGENKIVVLFDDESLEKQFGNAFPFKIKDKSVEFDMLNRSHSDLFALNSSISRAITEQCKELL